MKRTSEPTPNHHTQKPAPGMRVGIAWYRPEQWSRVREISDDRDNLEDTWEEWRQDAEKAMLGLLQRGIVPERVDVDLEELLAWCIGQNKLVNGEARAAFASEKLSQRAANEDPPGR